MVLALMLIPQTRQPIQVFINKGLAQFGPSVISKSKQQQILDYKWKLVNGKGETLYFEALKGKVVLVNFWATWCPPCIAEMPSIQALYERYKDTVSFVFVSNEASTAVTNFINAKGYTFPVYKPLTDYPKAFDVSSIPRTFLIDKQGHIVIDKSGAANWDSDTVSATIDALLNDL